QIGGHADRSREGERKKKRCFHGGNPSLPGTGGKLSGGHVASVTFWDLRRAGGLECVQQRRDQNPLRIMIFARAQPRWAGAAQAAWRFRALGYRLIRRQAYVG